MPGQQQDIRTYGSVGDLAALLASFPRHAAPIEMAHGLLLLDTQRCFVLGARTIPSSREWDHTIRWPQGMQRGQPVVFQGFALRPGTGDLHLTNPSTAIVR